MSLLAFFSLFPLVEFHNKPIGKMLKYVLELAAMTFQIRKKKVHEQGKFKNNQKQVANMSRQKQIGTAGT